MSKHVSKYNSNLLRDTFRSLGTYKNFRRANYEKTSEEFELNKRRWIIDKPHIHLYEVDRDNLPYIPVNFLFNTPHNKKIHNHERLVGYSYVDYLGACISNKFGCLSPNTLSRLRIINSESINRNNKGNSSAIMTVNLLSNIDNSINTIIKKDNKLKEYFETQLDNFKNFGINIINTVDSTEYKGYYQDLSFYLSQTTSTNEFKTLTFKAANIGVGYGMLIDMDTKKVLASITLDSKYKEYYLLKYFTERDVPLNYNIFKVVYDSDFINNTGNYSKELLKVWKDTISDIDPLKEELIDGQEFYKQIFSKHLNEPFEVLGPLEQMEENEIILEKFLKNECSTSVNSGHAQIPNTYIVD